MPRGHAGRQVTRRQMLGIAERAERLVLQGGKAPATAEAPSSGNGHAPELATTVEPSA